PALLIALVNIGGAERGHVRLMSGLDSAKPRQIGGKRGDVGRARFFLDECQSLIRLHQDRSNPIKAHPLFLIGRAGGAHVVA
ncbi:hypothetical protein O4H25_13735, partial [Staphylococcus equorum]|nr:hypothetical protein [Staphylococcus equorum]